MIFKKIYNTYIKLFLLIFLIISSQSYSQKTDIVALINGDKITGELEEMQTGLLELSTDNMGTIYIEWDKIKEISTDKFFQVELEDGRIYYGSFQPGEKAGTILLKGVTLEKKLFSKYIVKITRIQESFWDILGGYIQLGASYNKGSQVAEISFNSDFVYTTRKRQFELIINSVLSATEDNSTSKNQNAAFSYNKYLEHKWYWYALTSVNQNTSLGLNLRANVGAGIGNDFIQTNRELLNASVGIVGNREWYVDETEPQNNLTMLFSNRFKYFIYDDNGIILDSFLNIFPYITELGRVRLNYSFSLDWEIINNFYWDITFGFDLDNKPQSEDSEKIDYNINMGLKYTL